MIVGRASSQLTIAERSSPPYPNLSASAAEGTMRGLRTISAIAFASGIFASAISTSPTSAAPACGPLAIITSLDIVNVAGGRPGVTAIIVDKPVTLLVDTGAPFSTITLQAARELNVPIGP